MRRPRKTIGKAGFLIVTSDQAGKRKRESHPSLGLEMIKNPANKRLK